ncbi:hypothetical protein CPB86DRAFT_778258 [Serendipita vermifera]|nr:hypothetical protein CPB86DRAFT_778258 [Serendipita vermifera]
MVLNSISFIALPQDLLLFISKYLDLADLVNLSQVNRGLRQLSKTARTFWLETIHRQGVILPLPSHQSLKSFSAEDLHHGAHRATIRDRNFTNPDAKLLSHSLVDWSFVQSDARSQEFVDRFKEEPMDTNWMHLTHPNGDWIFLVSPNHVLRILDLRTKAIAWAGQLGNVGIDADESESLSATFALDFRGDEEVVIAMVVKNRYKR